MRRGTDSVQVPSTRDAIADLAIAKLDKLLHEANLSGVKPEAFHRGSEVW